MIGRKLLYSKYAASGCVLFLMLVLAACSGSGGDDLSVREPVLDPCPPTAVPEHGGCRIIAERVDLRAETPFVEDGKAVELEVVVFRPLVPGRHPTLVFHHGSTGNGSDPSRFRETFTSAAVIRHFVDRGYLVAFPQRRGRGSSDGLYDEGFTPDRSGYSCNAARSLAGAERALEDLDAITDWLRLREDVDTTQMLVGGVSRGGILALVHVARRPDVYLGAINFVGGWIGEGCGDHLAINRSLFVEAAGFPGPTLWLYGLNDSFYSIDYSRANFAAFEAAGGNGEMQAFERAPGQNGHFIVNDRERWATAVDVFTGSF